MLQSSYSRDFENDADSFAFKRLKEVGVSPRYFADIIMRMESHRNTRADLRQSEKTAIAGRRPHEYLSTHPSSAKRIERAMLSH
jgi:Zn-dependent protease with chaperone function